MMSAFHLQVRLGVLPSKTVWSLGNMPMWELLTPHKLFAKPIRRESRGRQHL